jgi:hypothetical protein
VQVGEAFDVVVEALTDLFGGGFLHERILRVHGALCHRAQTRGERTDYFV